MLHPVIEDQKREVSRLKMIVTDSLLNGLYFVQIPYHRIQSIDIIASSRMPDDYGRYFREMQTHPVLMWELGNVHHVLAQSPVASQLAKMYGPGRFEWVADFAVERGLDGHHITEVSENAPGSAYRMLRLRHPLSRALVVPAVRIARNPDELFSLMKSGQVDFKKTMLVLPSSSVVSPRPGAAATNFGSEIREYGDNRIVIDAHSDQPAYLLLNDKFDPDWRVTVNGRPTRMFRANFLVRGVEIPAGRSEVVFTYRLDGRLLWFTFGAWVAVLSGGIFCLFFRRVRG